MVWPQSVRIWWRFKRGRVLHRSAFCAFSAFSCVLMCSSSLALVCHQLSASLLVSLLVQYNLYPSSHFHSRFASLIISIGDFENYADSRVWGG